MPDVLSSPLFRMEACDKCKKPMKRRLANEYWERFCNYDCALDYYRDKKPEVVKQSLQGTRGDNN